MASLTRPSSVAMSTVRCRASAFNSMRRFSSSSCQTQVRCSLLRSGIANESSSQTFLSSRCHPSNQQHRTFFAKIARRFPASTQSARPPLSSGDADADADVEAEAEASTKPQPSSTPLQLTNLPYFVRRTPSNKLPVYLETKAGGTKRLTKIQKTEGDLEALKSDLAQALNLETGSKKSEVTINSTTGHIIVKGWRKDEIQKFLMERNF